MAWAEKLNSGKYRGRYRDAYGKRRSTELVYTHKDAAKRAAAVKEDSARRAMTRNPDAHRQVWGDWCAKWWPAREIEDSTKKADRYRLDKHVTPRWETVELGSITRQDVKDWAADLRRTGVSASTTQRIVHLLSASLSAAVDAEILTANPAMRLKLPATSVDVERYLTHDELDRILAQCETVHDQTVVLFLANTGLRWGEMTGLHWNRVDLDRLVLNVADTFVPETNRIKAYPKSRKSRPVPIPDWLCERLATLPRLDTCGVEHMSGRRCTSGLVFTSVRGRPIWSGRWSARFREAVAASGVGDVRPHDLRHTYASWQLQGGTSLDEVGKLLGHVSPTTTQKYAKLQYKASDTVLAALPAPAVGLTVGQIGDAPERHLKIVPGGSNRGAASAE